MGCSRAQQPNRGIISPVFAVLASVVLFLPSLNSRADYSWVKDQANDIGELLGGFEGSCPQGTNTESGEERLGTPSVCGGASFQEHSPTPKSVSRIGVAMATVEEWTWISKAMELSAEGQEFNKKVWTQLLARMKKGVDPKTDPALSSYLVELKDDLLKVGELEYELENIRLREAKGTARPTDPQLKKYCQDESWRLRYNDPFMATEKASAWIAHMRFMGAVGGSLRAFGSSFPTLPAWQEPSPQPGQAPMTEVQKAKARLEWSKQAFVAPSLEHPGVEAQIQGEFEKMLVENALPELLKHTDQALKKFKDVKARERAFGKQADRGLERGPEASEAWGRAYEKNIHMVLNDPELLESLLVSVAPEVIPGFQHLRNARCRLHNRVLKDQAVRAYTDKIASASMLAGGFAVGRLAVRGALAVLTGGEMAATSASLRFWVGLNALSVARDVYKHQAFKDRCGRLALAVANGSTLAMNGEGALDAFEQCHRDHNLHLLLSTIGTLGGAFSDSKAVSVLLAGAGPIGPRAMLLKSEFESAPALVKALEAILTDPKTMVALLKKQVRPK